jgi:hypothetical protein
MALKITIYSYLREVTRLQLVGGGSHGIGELLVVGGGRNRQCDGIGANKCQDESVQWRT